jgi:hypothetical protein
MRIRLLLISAVSMLMSCVYAQEQVEKRSEWKGYIKNLQGLDIYGSFDSAAWTGLIHNRINFKARMNDRLTFRLDLRNRVFFGTGMSKTPDFAQQIDKYPGLLDLSVVWIDQPSLVVHSVIDRMLIAYGVPKWDVTIGRQRINWGMNNVWNPNDIFNAYNFLDFDYEERPGNDAIRIQHYPKENATIELAWKPGRNRDSHIASFLYRFNRKKYDWQLLAGIFNTDLVAGAGWAGSIGEKGFKGEVSYFHPFRNISDSSGTISASIMMDQTFKDGWYLSASILYNGNPSGFMGSRGIYMSDISAKSLFPFRYAFHTGVVKNVADVWNLSAAFVYSPDHSSLIFFPTFSYNASERFDADLTVQSFFADNQGAYRMQGAAVYLRGKWTF